MRRVLSLFFVVLLAGLIMGCASTPIPTDTPVPVLLKEIPVEYQGLWEIFAMSSDGGKTDFDARGQGHSFNFLSDNTVIIDGDAAQALKMLTITDTSTKDFKFYNILLSDGELWKFIITTNGLAGIAVISNGAEVIRVYAKRPIAKLNNFIPGPNDNA